MKNVHSQIHLGENEPVVELILADYMDRYGPEVWQLTYSFKQAMEREDYFDKTVPQPHYFQIWPPEKGQPHTLMEFHYPPEVASPTLLDLLRQRNSAIEKICSSDSKMREVANLFLAGESNKILAVDATQFLRAALTAIASPESRETMAAIGIESGFDWILKPPVEPDKTWRGKRAS